MVGHRGSSAGSYLADPTSPIPSHCASIVVTSTLRVNFKHDPGIKEAGNYSILANKVITCNRELFEAKELFEDIRYRDIVSPEHVFWSALRMNPVKQRHTYVPWLFSQLCWQPWLFPAHSSMSANRKTSATMTNSQNGLYTKILEVTLFAYAYRLFHEDFSPINGALCWLYKMPRKCQRKDILKCRR